MRRSILGPLSVITLAAALSSANLHASRQEKAGASSLREGHGSTCIGCRVYVESTRGGPIRLDRGRLVAASQSPVKVCADPGLSLWFPEVGDHLAAYMASQSSEFK